MTVNKKYMEIFIIQQTEFHQKSYPYRTLKPVKYGKNKGKKGAYHAQCRRIFHENAWFFECKMIPKRFSLSGSAESRCIETVKFYLALRRAGYPVKMQEGEQLVQRFLGNEKIGIVPDDAAPCYCHSYFPEEHSIDFMNLPFEKREEVIARAE